MDIAAFASVAKYTELQQKVSLAVAKLVMDQVQIQAADAVKLMELSINPSVGSNLDLSL